MTAPAVELDASWHQPGWTNPETPAFRATVAAIAAEERWVIDGNYSAVRDIVWARADTVVWLDLPRSHVMARVTGRTVQRVVTGRRLWNGNEERIANLVNPVPEENIVLWAWTTYDHNLAKYEALMSDAAWPHLRWHRLRSADAVRKVLEGVS